jgi:hypothetical protein
MTATRNGFSGLSFIRPVNGSRSFDERGRQLRRPYFMKITATISATGSDPSTITAMRNLRSEPIGASHRLGGSAILSVTDTYRGRGGDVSMLRYVRCPIQLKTGHCQNQIRPPRVKLGQYHRPRMRAAARQAATACGLLLMPRRPLIVDAGAAETVDLHGRDQANDNQHRQQQQPQRPGRTQGKLAH